MTGLLLTVVLITIIALLFRVWLEQEDLSHLPYQRQQYLLSRAERMFFEALRHAAGDRFYVCPKIRLGDVLFVPPGTNRWYARFNRIAMKHLDFVVCSRATLSPILAFELDDRSHERPDRQARDAFVNAALQAAGLPLERVPVRREYATDTLREMIVRRVPPVPGSFPSLAADGMAERWGGGDTPTT